MIVQAIYVHFIQCLTGCAKTSWTLQQNDSTSKVIQDMTILRPFLEFSAIFTLRKFKNGRIWTRKSEKKQVFLKDI